MVKLIEKVRQKITELLKIDELRQLMRTLRFIFNNSDNETIRRTSKSLHDLLFRERYDKIGKVSGIDVEMDDHEDEQ
jgi:sugar diacid utilization regulator